MLVSVALGEQFSIHTPHWHGNAVLDDGKCTDIVPLMQAQMETVDMFPIIQASGCTIAIFDDTWTPGWRRFYKVEP